MKKKNKKTADITDWYRLSEDEVLSRLNTFSKGLSEEEAKKRIDSIGENILPLKKPPSLFKIIFDQLLSPLIYILIVAAVISFAIGDSKDAVFIFIVILINTAIGAYQEWKAERSSEALRNLLKICVTVKRNGEKRLINANYLVPGDIVYLESGGKVPADIRLIKETGLMTNESLLTGESTDVMKITDKIEREVPLSDRENMVYAGSMITTGRGKGVVVETGIRTEIGKIAEAVTTLEKVKPPLITRMEKFSAQISIIVLIACGLIAFVEFSRGASLIEVFFLAVALAVSSIPEGLPAALTVALSVGMSRMARKNVIIRRLHAVEGLGSCTLIASDKTGTLTVNKQTVKLLYLPDGQTYFVTGEGYNGEGEVLPRKNKYEISHAKELVKSSVICNEGSLTRKNETWVHQGDAVDVALLALGYKYGYNPEKLNEKVETLREIPFESERKFSANFYRDKSGVKVAVKGAFEVVLDFCTHMSVKNKTTVIKRKRIERQINALSGTGHRVIAVAGGDIKQKPDHEYYESDLKNLSFLGLIGLIDPLRPEAKTAVDKCKEAGIKVIMITGDHPGTSYTIGRNLSIVKSRDKVIEGSKLAMIDEKSDEYVRLVSGGIIFARVAPLQKLHIVEALSKTGNYIAVTGDGVNDAPALKKAHISVAMGSGTDVAKDVASIIVVDDNFASVVAGVEEGRYAYDNIRKVIYLLVSTGTAEIVLFALAIGFNMAVPLVAVQLLWLNLVTNGIQGVALAFEKGEKETMKKPPRSPGEGVFNKLMVQEILVSGISMGIIAYSFWYVLLANGTSVYAARNIILLLMVFFENMHVFNCRSEHKSAFKVSPRNNMFLVTGVLVAQAIHIISMNIPIMQEILDIQPVKISEWFYLLLFSVSILIIMELFKFSRRKHQKSDTDVKLR